jgi:hypothetical protein
MNEPSKDYEAQDERVARLKALQPRAPQLDWNAIQAARFSNDTNPVQAVPALGLRPIRIRPAVAWWSGLAAGAAIAFLAMHWFVVRELRSELSQLKQATGEASTATTNNNRSTDQLAPPSMAVLMDIGSIPERSDLSVGSYRSNGHSTISTSSDAESRLFSDAPTRARQALETEHSETHANRLMLLRELKQTVH